MTKCIHFDIFQSIQPVSNKCDKVHMFFITWNKRGGRSEKGVYCSLVNVLLTASKTGGGAGTRRLAGGNHFLLKLQSSKLSSWSI